MVVFLPQYWCSKLHLLSLDDFYAYYEMFSFMLNEGLGDATINALDWVILQLWLSWIWDVLFFLFRSFIQGCVQFVKLYLEYSILILIIFMELWNSKGNVEYEFTLIVHSLC